MRGLALVFLMMLVSPAYTQLCVVPVIDGQPTEEPEISKPYLMADNVSVIEDYPHLLIKRHPILNTIRNGRFEPLDVAFPDSFWSSYLDTYILPDGRTIGLGNDRII